MLVSLPSGFSFVLAGLLKLEEECFRQRKQQRQRKGINGKELGIVQGGQSLVGWSETSRRCGCKGRAELVGLGKEHRFLSLRIARSLFLFSITLVASITS